MAASEQMAIYQHYYKFFDRDGDGHITADELAEYSNLHFNSFFPGFKYRLNLYNHPCVLIRISQGVS